MACRIIRDNTGEVQQVLAPNNNPSKLYTNFRNLGYSKEEALEKWASTQTDEFKNWFGNSSNIDENGEPLIQSLEDENIFLNENNESIPSEQTFGSFKNIGVSPLVTSVNNEYDLVNNDNTPKIIGSKAIELAATIKKEHPGLIVTVNDNLAGETITVQVNPELNEDVTQHQIEDKQLSAADKNIDIALDRFFRSLGIKINAVKRIRNAKGELVKSAISRADITNRIVDVVMGKRNIETLPEEAAHFMVELLEAEGHPLFASLMNNIESYPIYQEVLNDKDYQEQYGDNLDKYKKEAIGKLIASAIVKQIKGNKNQQKRANNWFQKIWNMIKDWFGKVNIDPYSRAAYIMLNDKVNDYIDVDNSLGGMTGEFFQTEKEKDPEPKKEDPRETSNELFDKEQTYWQTERIAYEKLGVKKPWIVEEGVNLKEAEVERYVGRKGGPYAGVIVTGRPSDDVKRHFYKMGWGKKPRTSEQIKRDHEIAEMVKDFGTKGHATLEDLVKFYAAGKTYKTHKKDFLEIFKNAPFEDRAYFDVMARQIYSIIQDAKRRNEKFNKEAGTKGKVIFRVEQHTRQMFGKKVIMVGKSDLIIHYGDNSVDILDYKFISPSIEKGYVEYKPGRGYQLVEDPFRVKMDTYHIQMGHYKKHVIDTYKVNKVRRSRIVPIFWRAKYTKQGAPIPMTSGGKYKINTLQMGESMSEFLAHIPVAEEMTGYENVDKIIMRLIDRRKVVERRMRRGKQTTIQYQKDAATKSKLDRHIKLLQLHQDIGTVLREITENLKGVNKKLPETQEFLDNGDPNPNYLSLDDLIDIYNEIIFAKHFTKLPSFNKDNPTFMEDLQKENIEEFNKIKAIQDDIAGFLGTMEGTLELTIRGRVVENAEERGVKIGKDHNPGVGYMGSTFLNLSKQNNPYLRNLWEIVDEINYKKRKVVKDVAGEIQDLQETMLEWGRRNGLKPFEVMDKLINDKTGNFKAKFKTEFYELRDLAIRTKDTKWINENLEVDKEKYDRYFKEWRSRKIESLNRIYKGNQKAINRELANWDLLHDVVNHPKTAKVSRGAIWFLRPKVKWYSAEYLEISNVPELKNFYEYYHDMVKRIEDMYGEELGPGFIANVTRNSAENYFQTGDSKGSYADLALEGLQMREHDLSFGVRDDKGRIIRRVPRLWIRPILDANGKVDPTLKSRDLGKGLLLLFTGAIDYQMKMDVMPEIMAMDTLLNMNTGTLTEQERDTEGGIIKTLGGKAKQAFVTKSAADTYNSFIDTYFFGASVTTKDQKIFGGRFSLIKTLLGAKQYHSKAMLGLKTPVAIAAFFAGMFSLEQQAAKGKFIKRKYLRNAQKAMMRRDPKIRALAEHLEIYQRDDTTSRATRTSAHYITRHMTDDKFFTFLATADKGIDVITLATMAQNYGIDPETGDIKLLDKLPEGTKSVWDIMEIKDNPKYKETVGNISNRAADKYIVTIPGLNSKNERKLRNKSRRISDKVKGSMSDEDRALYNNNLYIRLMMHYKSWLPGIAYERFGKLRYDHILESHDEGTWRSMFGNIGMNFKEALDAETHVDGMFKAIAQDGINISLDIVTFGYANRFKVKEGRAKIQFDRWADAHRDDPEFTERLKTEYDEMFREFIEMKQGNIRATLLEIRFALMFMMLLMLMKGDWDDDGKIDMRQSWAGRKLYNVINRTYREVAVFTNPGRFVDSGRISSLPILSAFGDLKRLFNNTISESYELLTGKHNASDRTNLFHYTFKWIPGINAFAEAIEWDPSYKQRGSRR